MHPMLAVYKQIDLNIWYILPAVKYVLLCQVTGTDPELDIVLNPIIFTNKVIAHLMNDLSFIIVVKFQRLDYKIKIE